METNDLEKRVTQLEMLAAKNEYTNLSVFLKEVLFKSGVTMQNNKLPAVGVTTGSTNTIILKKLETNWVTQGTPIPIEGEVMLARNLATNKMYLMAGISGGYTAKVELT